MTSRELVYQKVGRAAELAQLLETEVGTALLALDALQTKSFLAPNPDAYARLRKEIEGQTLGQSLKNMRAQLSLHEDLEAKLSEALAIRNHLAHHFFRTHGLAMLEEEGRGQMVAELDEHINTLHAAYTVAGNVAHALAAGVQELKQGSANGGA